MRKAQAALEYLMTYGWALLIIMLVILILFYLGILNPSSFVGVRNQVTGLGTIIVRDFAVNGSGYITLYLINNADVSINLTNNGIKIKDATLSAMSPSSYGNWRPGANLTVTGISTLTGIKGDAFYNVKIDFNYTIIGGGNHMDSGIMSGKID